MLERKSLPSVSRFRPPTPLDFARCAKNLSWLIDEPLQKSQELLARIYGYANLHELQADFRLNLVPGPYDSDIFGGGNTPDIAKRHNRFLHMIAECKGVGIGDLDSRVWEGATAGFFDHPAIHRRLFQDIVGSESIYDVDGPSAAETCGNGYATIDVQEDGGAVAVFTQLGRNVYDAICKITPGVNDMPVGTLDNVLGKMSAVINRHPNSPWAHAVPLCAIAHLMSNGAAGRWSIPMFLADGYADSPSVTRNNAKGILPMAEKAISLFEELYGEHWDRAADHRLLTTRYSFGGDAFYWPASLYWGGMIALAAGERKLARKWLRKNRRIVKSDNFGSRFVLEKMRGIS